MQSTDEREEPLPLKELLKNPWFRDSPYGADRERGAAGTGRDLSLRDGAVLFVIPAFAGMTAKTRNRAQAQAQASLPTR